QELSHIISNELIKPFNQSNEYKWYNIVPNSLTITYKKENTFNVAFSTRFISKILPVSVNYTLKFSPSDSSFTILNTFLGKVPVSKSNIGKFSSKISDILKQNENIQNLKSKIKTISYEQNKFIITTN
ncbi:MAG: hypothetical protein ACRC37_06355, partial [Lentisphaeria bacterium]